MTITPFMTLKLRRKKDILLARQRARRAANLLGFDPAEQACIAAGTFVIASQALARFGRARLRFLIEDGQLRVDAEEIAEPTAGNRITEIVRESDARGMFRLVKELPAERKADERDLGWLVLNVEDAASEGIYEEIVKQNQEMLTLLHELRLYRENSALAGEKKAPPHAA